MAIKVVQPKIETTQSTTKPSIKVVQPLVQTEPQLVTFKDKSGVSSGGLGKVITAGNTLKNTATQIGKGVLKFGESAFDTALQIGNSKYNPFNTARGEQLKANQQTARNIIASDSTQELLDKVGYSKVDPQTGLNYQQALDAQSKLKSYGTGGQIAQAIGQQLPNIVLGNLGTGVAAKTAASIIPTTISSFGSGVEQAYQGGATRGQATGYGLLNAAVESATEFITGGVPGVKTGFLTGLDTVAEKGIKKLSSELAQTLVRSGYKVVGEGFEEALAELLNPLIKNMSYSKGEKVKLQNIIDSAVQGAIVGGLLNAPSSIAETSNAIQQQNAIKQQNKPITQTITPTNTITPTTPQTTQGVTQIQPQDNINNAKDFENYYKNVPIENVAPPELSNERYNTIDTISMDRRTTNLLLNNKKQQLGLNKTQMKTLENIIQKFNTNENATEKSLYNDISKEFSEMNVETKLNDVLNIQRELRNRKINVSNDIKQGIKDYSQLKLKNFGKIGFSNDGSTVDSVYQELSNTYPDYFPDNIWNPEDQLLKMIEVANMDKTAIEKIALPKEMILEATKYITDATKDYRLDADKKFAEQQAKAPIDEKLIPKERGATQQQSKPTITPQVTAQEEKNIKKSNDINKYIDAYIEQKDKYIPNREQIAFTIEHESDFNLSTDKNVRVRNIFTEDNVAKLTTTEQNGKIFIDELYVQKRGDGFGSKIVNALKAYAKDNNLELDTSDELLSAKTFWDKTLREKATTQETTPETKQRGVFSTALENQNIPTDIKSGIKGLDQNYIVITDQDALSNAQQRLTSNGYDKSLTTLETKFNNNEKLSKYDIAEATLLYNDAFAKGDTQKALDILTSIAVAGTESGQVSQATSILQRSTPDGRLLALQKQVNKINDKFKTDIKIDAEDMNNIKNAQNKTDLDTAINNAIVKVSKQMPNTLANRLNEWRYLAMLGNPKTHIRNIVSNLAMKGTSKVKNTLSAFIEDTVKPTERTRTLEKASQQTKEFVNKDVEEQKARIQGTDKYDQNKLGIKPTPSKLSALNSALLEWEDWKFSSGAYKDALSNYITANKIDVNNATPQQLESARQYAIEQAQEQTFRQFSKLAESISKFGNKNKLVKIATDAVLPFKTTPINIAKTGIEYSPIGLAKTLTKNAIDLKNGNIKPAKFIDNISKGLTGTAITALGYTLAEAGLLTASGSDEDKENYFQQMYGKQPYSIQIGGKNITLDWLSPSAMPFFMGAEISEMKRNGMDKNKLLNIASGISTIVDPLTEMSMLQGINSTLKSYDESALGGVVINAVQNYALQYIPTISGQLARTLTPERKSTTGAGTGIEKKFNTFTNKVKAKIPVLANTLEPYVDQFGNTQVTNSIAQRAFENFLSPAYIKDVKTENVYKEIQKLYDKTGEKSILPTSSQRYFTENGEKIYLTPEEYTKFSTIDGQYSLNKLNSLFNSNAYKSMSDEAKINAIESFYKASQKVAKATYNK